MCHSMRLWSGREVSGTSGAGGRGLRLSRGGHYFSRKGVKRIRDFLGTHVPEWEHQDEVIGHSTPRLIAARRAQLVIACAKVVELRAFTGAQWRARGHG